MKKLKSSAKKNAKPNVPLTRQLVKRKQLPEQHNKLPKRQQQLSSKRKPKHQPLQVIMTFQIAKKRPKKFLRNTKNQENESHVKTKNLKAPTK